MVLLKLRFTWRVLILRPMIIQKTAPTLPPGADSNIYRQRKTFSDCNLKKNIQRVQQQKNVDDTFHNPQNDVIGEEGDRTIVRSQE